MNGTIDAMARAIIDRVYPVNVIVEFSLETDPNIAIGCGTRWERFAAGRALIGGSGDYAVGWEGGEASHKMTVDEMPSHTHAIYVFSNSGTETTSCPSQSAQKYVQRNTTPAGGGKAHNNMQPSRAVDRWVRVA